MKKSILYVGTPKGGTGKTTLAISIANRAVRTGKNAIYIDADVTPHGTRHYSNVKKESGLEKLFNGENLIDCLEEINLKNVRALPNHKRGKLYLLSGNENTNDLLIKKDSNNELIKGINFLRYAKDQVLNIFNEMKVDLIIIDTHPVKKEFLINKFFAEISRYFVIPTTDPESLTRYINMINFVRYTNKNNPIIISCSLKQKKFTRNYLKKGKNSIDISKKVKNILGWNHCSNSVPELKSLSCGYTLHGRQNAYSIVAEEIIAKINSPYPENMLDNKKELDRKLVMLKEEIERIKNILRW